MYTHHLIAGNYMAVLWTGFQNRATHAMQNITVCISKHSLKLVSGMLTANFTHVRYIIHQCPIKDEHVNILHTCTYVAKPYMHKVGTADSACLSGHSELTDTLINRFDKQDTLGCLKHPFVYIHEILLQP